MSLKKDIAELLKANVITPEVGSKIQAYYTAKSSDKDSKLFLIFGIIGAVLVGLGLILIMAHNWDRMSRWLKILIAFTPLILGQLSCVYAYLNKPSSIAWREGSATFLLLSVGGCFSLISQIYHLPGDISSFTFIWMLLALPIIYLARSSMVSVLYILGTIAFATQTGPWSPDYADRFQFYILLVGTLPYYFSLIKYHSHSYATTIHHWLFPVVISVGLFTSGLSKSGFLAVVFACLFGLFYMIGHLDLFYKNKLRNNSYLVLGSLSSVVLLFLSSYSEFWKYIVNENYIFSREIAFNIPLVMGLVIVFMTLGMLTHVLKKFSYRNYKPLFFSFLLFAILYVLNWDTLFQGLVINALLFVIGITTIYNGIQKDHLGILNYGLLITTLWIMVRFFNFDVTFIVRGLILVGLGIGFFMANFYLLKKRKKHVN
jgi:uncharacterized membrane protein